MYLSLYLSFVGQVVSPRQCDQSSQRPQVSLKVFSKCICLHRCLFLVNWVQAYHCSNWTHRAASSQQPEQWPPCRPPGCIAVISVIRELFCHGKRSRSVFSGSIVMIWSWIHDQEYSHYWRCCCSEISLTCQREEQGSLHSWLPWLPTLLRPPRSSFFPPTC